MEASLKITVLVENDQTESLTVDQGGDPVTVAPGQNATIEVLSTHPVTISVVSPSVAEPEKPADPIVEDSPTVGISQTVPATLNPDPPPISFQGDTGAKVVPDDAPQSVRDVAARVAAANSAIATANGAAGDHAEAMAKLEDARIAHQDAPDEDAAALAKSDGMTAGLAAQTAAAALDAGLQEAEAHLSIAGDLVEKVKAAAEDENDLTTTTDHADLAASLVENAKQAISETAQGSGDGERAAATSTEDPEKPSSEIAPAATLGEDQPLTAVDGSTPAPTELGDATAATPITKKDEKAAASFPEPSNATVLTLIQQLADNDAAQTEQGEISIPHLNAALVANGFAPISTDHPALEASDARATET